MKKINSSILIIALILLSGCNSDSKPNNENSVYTTSELIEYSCDIQSSNLQGCWVSQYCATSEQFSGRIVMEFDGSNLNLISAGSYTDECEKVPTLIGSVITTHYNIDSVVTSSDGSDISMYQIGDAYTLINITDNVLCFSDGFFNIEDGDFDFETITKENVSVAINFNNCLERI